MYLPHLAVCFITVTILSWVPASSIKLKELELEVRASTTWQECAVEGEAVRSEGPTRFGWGEDWVEANLPAGATCGTASFGGSDPVPNVRKLCQCATPADGQARHERAELGVTWARCAQENAACNCASGVVRFGEGARWVGEARGKSAAPFVCSAAAFTDADPASGIEKECWCMRAEEQMQRKRVAIVMVTRHPPDLGLWLRYHLGFVEVDHVFIQIEDSPELNESAPMWSSLPKSFHERVTVWRSVAPSPSFLQPRSSGTSGSDKRPADDYTTLQARQVQAMHRAKVEAQRLQLDWLVHIDDDELLYSPVHRPIGEILAAMPDMYTQAYIPNVEAIYRSADVRNCFAETAQVNTNRFKYVGYANGKAAVRVLSVLAEESAPDQKLEPAGPHQWRNPYGLEPPSIHLDDEPFGPPVMVVHFESCPFARWEDKYWELGNTSPEKVADIPFPFYRESIQRMQECRGQDGSAKELPDCSREALTRFWSSWKTTANGDLTPGDLMGIRIPWAEISAL